MGRPFQTELEDLNETYKFAYSYDDTEIHQLSRFLLNLYEKPILIVGSGGSYSVAKILEYLHNSSPLLGVAKAVTPLELSILAPTIRNVGVILVTANGNNNDTVNVYKFIKRCLPISFLTLCLNKASKIKKLTDTDSTTFIGDRLTRGKDGYLAVNSVLAFTVMVARAYNKITPSPLFMIPENLDTNIKEISYKIEEIQDLQKESTIVLFSDCAMPIAIDIESKFSEASLGNVLLSDYRNFAHGRHFWLSNRSTNTTILSLVTPKNQQLASKTLELIPQEIPKVEIQTTYSGARGIIDLFVKSVCLVKDIGVEQGIDPGRPPVPEFGKKMYHISYTPESFKLMKINDKLEGRSVYRKCSIIDSLLFQDYKRAFRLFKEKMEDTMFHEIVFDYDATLVEKYINPNIEKEIFNILNTLLKAGITVKIATGRGKSVRKEMRQKIHYEYWKNIVIGYYNGGIIAPLTDDDAPNVECQCYDKLVKLEEELVTNIPEFKGKLKPDIRPQQLTIMMDSYEKLIYRESIIEIARHYGELKVLSSGHSIDIIPLKNSKLSLINDADKNALCIGDSGQYGGNDYELLSSPYSLGVNRISTSGLSCWNYAPVGLNNTKATLYYLKQLEIHEGYFKIAIQ